MRRTLMTAAVIGLAVAGLGGVALAASNDGRAPGAVFGTAEPSAGPSVEPSAGPSVEPSAGPSVEPSVEPSVGPTFAPGAAAGGDGIGMDRAARIAVDRVGRGRVTEVEREWEHGRLVWEVEVYADGVEYDVEVDARTGAVVRFRVDDDGRHRGRGHGDDD